MNPNAKSDLSRRAVRELLRLRVAKGMKILGVHVDRYSQASLHAIHDVAIAAIKCQIVPCPIGDCADLVAATQEIEQVEP